MKRQNKINIDDEKKHAQRQIYSIRTDAERKIEEIKRQLDIAYQEIDNLKNVNENLIRISKERANSTRNITPKKQHSGYVLLNVEETNYSFRNRRTVENYACWRIKFQTPYDITIDINAVRKLIHDDFIKKFGGKIGLSSKYTNGSLEEMNLSEIQELWDNPENFVFKTNLKINAIKGFWEIEYLTKDIIKIIPEILSPKNKIFLC